jgi:hypothetical protein
VIRAVNQKLCCTGIQIIKVIIAPSFTTLWQFSVLISLVDIQIIRILWRVPFTVFCVRPLWTAYTHVPELIQKIHKCSTCTIVPYFIFCRLNIDQYERY